MIFDGFELKDEIVEALNELKFSEFSEIQRLVFSSLKDNKNIIIKSKTGSGKTHAFLIPIFNNIDTKSNEVFATIVAPTKELAKQIYDMSMQITKHFKDKINIKLYISGSDRLKELEKLDNNMPNIVIATPGKLYDLAIANNALKIYTSKYYVIDEVDMALDAGYSNELDAITAVLKDATMFVSSATIKDNIINSLKKYMENAKVIALDDEISLNIKHIWIPLKHRDRYFLLKDLISTFNAYLCIIFVNKKELSQELYSRLAKDGYNVALINGDMSSRERKRILDDARKLKYQYIVSTDVIARGIDIEGVSHVINYELPKDYEFYIHRSGRTGRMSFDGIAYSFYTDLDDEYLNNLSKKDIKPIYMDIKDKTLVEYKGRNLRSERKKPTSNYEVIAKRHIPLGKKKPGYKKKRQKEVEELAKRLEKKDKKKKWYY